MAEENRIFMVDGGFAETAIWRARFQEFVKQWATSGLPGSLSSRVARSFHFDTCYRDWKWSPSLPEFQWQLVEHVVPQEHILHGFQMPDLSDSQSRSFFSSFLSNLSLRYVTPRETWESHIGREPPEDVEGDEAVCPHDISLTSFTLARPGGETLKVLYIEHHVDLDMGMFDSSMCLACLGRGDPIVLAQWRLHSEADMFDPAYFARPEAMDELLAHTGLKGQPAQDVVAFLLSVCAANPPAAHLKRNLQVKRPLEKQIARFIRQYEESSQMSGGAAAIQRERERAGSNISRTYQSLAEVHDLLPSDAQRKLYRQYLETSITFLMGQHARLGEHSPVFSLPSLPISIIVAVFLRDQARGEGGGRRIRRRRRRELPH